METINFKVEVSNIDLYNKCVDDIIFSDTDQNIKRIQTYALAVANEIWNKGNKMDISLKLVNNNYQLTIEVPKIN